MGFHPKPQIIFEMNMHAVREPRRKRYIHGEEKKTKENDNSYQSRKKT